MRVICCWLLASTTSAFLLRGGPCITNTAMSVFRGGIADGDPARLERDALTRRFLAAFGDDTNPVVVAFALGTLVQLVQGRFFELYALIHTTQAVFASNEKFANVTWEALKPRVAGQFEWPDLLMSAPSVLKEKFVKHATQDELQEMRQEMKQDSLRVPLLSFGKK